MSTEGGRWSKNYNVVCENCPWEQNHENAKKKSFQIKRAYKSLYFQGFFKNGEAYGHFWIQMEGGGHLHGKVNSEGLISGNNIAYIYPDGETALLGKFEDRVMIEARQH